MDKIFFNPEIYESYQDYALGGFVVKESEAVSFNTIYTNIYDRVEYLVFDYINRGMIANNFDTSRYSKEDALVDIGFMLKDYFGMYPEVLTEEIVHKTIMDTEQMSKWLNLEIKERIKAFPFSQNLTSFTLQNDFDMNIIGNEKLYQEAQDATHNTTLEQYLEQLSLIEL